MADKINERGQIDHMQRILGAATGEDSFVEAPEAGIVSEALMEHLHTFFKHPAPNGALAAGVDGAQKLSILMAQFQGQCDVIRHLEQLRETNAERNKSR